MRLLLTFAVLSFASGCGPPGTNSKLVTDRDGDGLEGAEDCDDTDAGVGGPTSYYFDEDLDGHGSATQTDSFCEQPEGYVAVGDDCDDTNAAVYPGAEDVCDGLDNDCDGDVDDGAVAAAWYTDADGDGYGDDASTVMACTQPEGSAAQGGDCDDADAAYNPGATEEDCEDPNDYNCDGSVGYADNDADGFAACQECDDASAAVNPDATEVCNDTDDDCDARIDDDDDSLDASTGSTWFADVDFDGYGDPAAPAQMCDPGPGWVADSSDCDDTRPDLNPGATETCNGQDDDCDGLVDDADDSLDASTASVWYTDADADGYGDDALATLACEAPSGAAALAGDCNDADTAYNPGASESDCTDPADYNCDGATGYTDGDGDGYAACEECDDTNAANNPAATELCDGADNDCDGTVDEADAADASTWYADADSDGYGNAGAATLACDAPAGTVADATDCDDTTSAVNPAVVETCNGIDDNCDGTVDEDSAADAATWYADTDGDGYGDAASSTDSCAAPAGYVSDATDCDDTNGGINPGAAEVCDGVDQDCSGTADDGLATFASYADTDGDGFGNPGSATVDCAAPAGTVLDGTDCDDGDAAVNPAATEVCDSVDNDCDGSVDPADSWWDTAWPYRVLLTVTASGYDVDSPPVLTDVDFRGLLDALGDTGALDPDTIRVVTQDCSAGPVELPSQYLEDYVGLLDKVSADDTTTEYGTLGFLLDADGDYTTLDAVAAGSVTTVGVYFGGSATDPAYTTDLVATSASLGNDVTTAEFSASAGGLLSSLSTLGSSSVEDQATSCCGNSFYGGSWGIDPQDGAGDLALLFDGPVLAAVEASGARSDSQSGYEYSYIYLAFAGRPELYSKVLQVTDRSSTLSHGGDFTSGIRPWETRRENVTTGGTFTTDAAYLYADVSNGTWGSAFAYVQPPQYVVGLANYDPYLIAVSNDYAAAGLGTGVVLPSGTAYLDNVVMLHLPHSGDFDSVVQSTLFGLSEGVAVTQGGAEAR